MSDSAVVYLEADDEITTAVRRVRSSDAARVIVAVPGRSRATSSAVALRLLARAADEEGREVAVVGDALTRSLAAEAGLTAYATLDSARGAETPEPHEPTEVRHAAIHVVRGTEETVARPAIPAAEVPRPVHVGDREAAPSRRRSLVAILVALIALALVLGLAGAAVLPGATVTIEPLTQAVGPVAFVVEVNEAEQLSGTAEAATTVTATGRYDVVETATGSVVLFNWSSVDQMIAAGTLVAAGEQAFETQADVVVPRGSLTPQGTIRAGEAAVGVVASAPGPAGNVPAGAIDTVLSEGADARLRGFRENSRPRVANPEPTTGGLDETGVRFTRRDVNVAIEALTADLRGQVGDALAEHADEIVVQSELAEPMISGLDGLVGTRDQDDATIEGTLEWEAWLGDRGQVIDEARRQVADDPSVVPEGHAFEPGSVEVAIEEANVENGAMRVDLTATGRSVAQIEPEEVAQRVAGLTAGEAEASLEDLGSATVELWPDWVESVPSMEWRIEVRVDEP